MEAGVLDPFLESVVKSVSREGSSVTSLFSVTVCPCGVSDVSGVTGTLWMCLRFRRVIVPSFVCTTYDLGSGALPTTLADIFHAFSPSNLLSHFFQDVGQIENVLSIVGCRITYKPVWFVCLSVWLVHSQLDWVAGSLVVSELSFWSDVLSSVELGSILWHW